jgi:hypothetical protein
MSAVVGICNVVGKQTRMRDNGTLDTRRFVLKVFAFVEKPFSLSLLLCVALEKAIQLGCM